MALKIGNREIAILAFVLIGAFSLIFFGLTGFRTIIGLIILFFLPFYIILDNFELDTDEKVFFSIFLGAMLFPSLAYILGLVMGLRISIAVSFVIFLSAGLAMRKFSFKGNKSTSSKAE